MLYNIGDVLVCKNTVNAQCLEMTNPNFDIKCGDKYKVTDKDDFPDDNHCHWYELTSEKDKSIVVNAWNDEGHMIIDNSFEPERFMKELLQRKGFSLNTYPEGKFWELTVEDNENLKVKICKIFNAEIEVTVKWIRYRNTDFAMCRGFYKMYFLL